MKKPKHQWKVGDAVGVTSSSPLVYNTVYTIACFSMTDPMTAWVSKVPGGPRLVVRVCDLYKPFGRMLTQS